MLITRAWLSRLRCISDRTTETVQQERRGGRNLRDLQGAEKFVFKKKNGKNTQILIGLHINYHLWMKRWVGRRHFTVHSFIFLNHSVKYTFFERIVFQNEQGLCWKRVKQGIVVLLL